MSLYVHVAFAPYVNVRASVSLALANPAFGTSGALSACVLIRRTPAVSVPLELADPMLFDKGAHTSPAELNIAFSEIANYLRDEGSGAKVVVEPLVASTLLRLDIALQRSADGETWQSEMILRNCGPAQLDGIGVRSAHLPELHGSRARIKIRCTSTTSVPLRIWANEPRVASRPLIITP